MTRLAPRLGAVAALALVGALAPRAARADDRLPAQEQPAAPPPGYQRQPVQSPQYVAPLYQQAQPSYVPQSVALSGPREIKDWQEGEPIPPGYRPASRTRSGLVVGGAVTFGVLYTLSVLVAAANADVAKSTGGSNPATALYVPGVGPFIQMTSTESATLSVMLAIDGLAQSAGLAMFVVGLTSPKTVLVRNDLADATKPTFRLTPMLGASTTGAGVVGTF